MITQEEINNGIILNKTNAESAAIRILELIKSEDYDGAITILNSLQINLVTLEILNQI